VNTPKRPFRLDRGQTGSYSGPEVRLWEVKALDMIARFWLDDGPLGNYWLTSGLPPILPLRGGPHQRIDCFTAHQPPEHGKSQKGPALDHLRAKRLPDITEPVRADESSSEESRLVP
jgi:hypothetical protein